MPYLKPREPEQAKIRRLLLGYGVGASRLADILSVSEKTARSRLNNPGTITLEELHRISRSAHIPADEIREAICFS